jgi:hypothetical protein
VKIIVEGVADVRFANDHFRDLTKMVGILIYPVKAAYPFFVGAEIHSFGSFIQI